MAQYMVRMEGAEERYEAASPEAAQAYAEQWAREGDWDLSGGTIWVHAWYAPVPAEGEEPDWERAKVQIDPAEPECRDSEGHDWQSPLRIVGGLPENPGVWGHGGGVTITEVCMRCGCGKHTDTWAQDPETGEQGLNSLRYEEGEYRDRLAVRLAEKWEESGDDHIVYLLTLSDERGEEVAGAIYDPDTDEYDTTSDGCGIRCDPDHPAYHRLREMDAAGDWPSPPNAKLLAESGEWTGNLVLRA